MADANAVSQVVVRGAQGARSAASKAEHGGGAFDVWSHTEEGQAAAAGQTTGLLNMPVTPIESGTSVGVLPTAMGQQVDALKQAAADFGKAKGALATAGAAMGALTALEQAISTPLSAIPFPAYPAIRVMDMDVGLPHAHNHPPNLVPPAPPVPLPSTGPVIPIPYVSGAATVLINGMPAGRCGDMGMGIWCGSYFPMYEIFLGSSSVWIEGMRAARLGVDITKHCIFSVPKPNDPPLGPMIGMTISSSANVVIGGVPMPSLTNMAVGAAMKAAFKGLGKVVGRIRRTAALGRMAHLEAPGGMGRVHAPRTPGLSSRISLAELLAMEEGRGGVPGRGGVILTDVVQRASELYGDLFKMSEANGIEYALTRENGELVLRSGGPDTVSIPRGVTPIAHTHPPDELNGIQPHPSRADVNTLNDVWSSNPDGPRPTSDIVWGTNPDNVTSFGATGVEPIPDPTKGGLKPQRSWR